MLIDCDPQASLTISLGHPYPDELETTLATLLEKSLTDEEILYREGILHHEEGVDILPSNIRLSDMEVSLVNAWSREQVLSLYIESVKPEYDYILIDCMPSLGMLTLNALTAANSVLIPVQAQYLSVKGVEQLAKTIFRIRKRLNKNLSIAGILLTMVDYRTTYAKEIRALLHDTYDEDIPFFSTEIPHSIRAAETSRKSKSIFTHDPNGKVADAYKVLTMEVLGHE